MTHPASAGLRELADKLDALGVDCSAQRDELLAALRMYCNAGFGQSTDFHLQGLAWDAAQKAIANCVTSREVQS